MKRLIRAPTPARAFSGRGQATLELQVQLNGGDGRRCDCGGVLGGPEVSTVERRFRRVRGRLRCCALLLVGRGGPAGQLLHSRWLSGAHKTEVMVWSRNRRRCRSGVTSSGPRVGVLPQLQVPGTQWLGGSQGSRASTVGGWGSGRGRLVRDRGLAGSFAVGLARRRF